MLLRCPAGYTRPLTIPETVTKIADCAFAGCNGLPSLTLNNRLIELGTGALMGCFRLNTLYLPATLRTIGENAFSGCAHLNTVYLPSSVDAPDELFADCENAVIVRF